MQKRDICELNPDELKEVLKELGEPAYRAMQLFSWLHAKHVTSFSEMSDLPVSLRERLSENWEITPMQAADVLCSRLDGTRKYVFALGDGNVIESVLMRYHYGNSVCISSQVGCRMGCTFCASTLGGCVRDLTAAEMLAQVYRIESDCGEKISHVVVMGSGEPMDNLEELVRFLQLLNHEKALRLSLRNVTVSTCGLPERIRQFAEYRFPLTLALSLHAYSQEKREKIMPIARRYPLPEVLSACQDYASATGRRLSFEYALVRGVNDSLQDAEGLARLLRPYHGHVNLIPVNPIEERSYQSPSEQSVRSFRDRLEELGINATIRRELGRDIRSACGQLRRSFINDASKCTDG